MNASCAGCDRLAVSVFYCFLVFVFDDFGFCAGYTVQDVIELFFRMLPDIGIPIVFCESFIGLYSSLFEDPSNEAASEMFRTYYESEVIAVTRREIRRGSIMFRVNEISALDFPLGENPALSFREACHLMFCIVVTWNVSARDVILYAGEEWLDVWIRYVKSVCL